ncbi:MAG TPA: hypothetical protein VFI11_05225 [Anaerolineales bacterium]|nr:hypothetical protein [Anaerolineales bacterium]
MPLRIQAVITHAGSMVRHPLVRIAIILIAASIACGLPRGAAPPATVIEPTIRPLPAATSVPAGPSSSPSPAAPLAFRDDFDGALDDSWSWLNEDPSAWSLSATPGWLRIGLSQSGFLTAPPSNVLLRPAPDGDFDLRTWVRVSPSRNFELAGLIVYFGDGAVLQFGHGFCDVSGACAGDGYYYDSLEAGSAVGGNFASAGFGGSEDLLRLVRRGNTYTAYYLVDDTTWIEVGSHMVDRAPISVGLIAAQAPAAGTFAEFDYFETVAE